MELFVIDIRDFGIAPPPTSPADSYSYLKTTN